MKRFTKYNLLLLADSHPQVKVTVIGRRGNRGLYEFKRGSVVVTEWGDGSYTRTDVRLDLANKMSPREVAKALELI